MPVSSASFSFSIASVSFSLSYRRYTSIETDSIHLLDIRQWPAPIEVWFQRRVESETHEPRLAWYGLNPVLLMTFRRGRGEVNVDRAVVILREVLPRSKLGSMLLVQN